jgi:hypothetical protein
LIGISMATPTHADGCSCPLWCHQLSRSLSLSFFVVFLSLLRSIVREHPS